MQDKRSRVLGMTAAQFFIIACLGLTLLGVMYFAGRVILGNSMPSNINPVPPTQENLDISMPIPTRTPFPSPTPLLPTLTFTATTYESLIPEQWAQVKYAKVEFWIPADFVKKSSNDFLVYAENPDKSGNGFPVSINLTSESTKLSDLDDYVQEGLMQFSPGMTLLEKKKFEIGNYEVRRLRIQMIYNNVPVGNAIYFIKDGDTVWILSGISHYDEFRKWILIFDKIAHTFRFNQ